MAKIKVVAVLQINQSSLLFNKGCKSTIAIIKIGDRYYSGKEQDYSKQTINETISSIKRKYKYTGAIMRPFHTILGGNYEI